MSSPYSSNNLQKIYDVFLSFRGEDTRSGFTSHLNQALIREGYKTFFDDENLARGKAIATGLLKAIEDSHCSIVVLSENYAFSSWCLTELVEIVECMETRGLIILPIFYHVDPSHVRKQNIGSFKEAFKRHLKDPKHEPETVETWREALKTVANLAGWTLEESTNEAKFLNDFIAKLPSQLDAPKESGNIEQEGQNKTPVVINCPPIFKIKNREYGNIERERPSKTLDVVDDYPPIFGTMTEFGNIEQERQSKTPGVVDRPPNFETKTAHSLGRSLKKMESFPPVSSSHQSFDPKFAFYAAQLPDGRISIRPPNGGEVGEDEKDSAIVYHGVLSATAFNGLHHL